MKVRMFVCIVCHDISATTNKYSRNGLRMNRIESNRRNESNRRKESKCSYPCVFLLTLFFLRPYHGSVSSFYKGLELISAKFHEHDTEGTGFLTAAQLCTAFTPICEALDVPVPDTDRIQARLAALQTEKEGHVNLIEMIFLFGYLKVMIICTRTYGNSRKHAIHCFYYFHTHVLTFFLLYVLFVSLFLFHPSIV